MRHRPQHMKRYRLHRTLRTLLVLAVLAVVVYPFAEPYWIRLDTQAITDSSLPSDIRRLRICYVSDLHISSFPFFTEKRAAGLIQEINRQNADIIILGGDYTNSYAETLAFLQKITAQSLPRFRASYGVYAVLGEHDRPETDAEMVALRRAASDAGITLLSDSVTTVRIGTSAIQLVGVDPARTSQQQLAALSAQVRADDYVILISHSPAVLPNSQRVSSQDGKQGWYDLALFGHTHGGQAPFLSEALGLTVSGVPETEWHTENRVPILISNGIGTVGVPIRLMRWPHIHVITVTTN